MEPKVDSETFVLQSPSLEPEPRAAPTKHVQIDARHDTVTDSWYANVGSVKGAGESLSAVLHEIANKIDVLGVYGSSEVRIRQWIVKKHKLCEYCDGKIIFGQLESKRWIPLDVEMIDADAVKGVGLAVFIDVNSKSVGFPAKPGGKAFLPHPEVCGLKATPPKKRAMKERWLINRKVAELKALERRQRDISLIRELTQEIHEAK